jgi:carboxypeptidase Taq
MPGAWEHFSEWSATLADIAGVSALLGWDRETGMPPGGAEARAQQLGTLAAMYHRELVRPETGPLLDELAADDALTPVRRRQVELAMRDRARAVRVPERLVRELSEAKSRSVAVWVETRPRGDWETFAQALTPVVALRRAEAGHLSDGGEPYDALLDQFEPGARAVELEPLFSDLRARLVPLVERGAARGRRRLPPRRWPADAQLALARDLAELVGYDLSRGAITVSAHPFTISPGYGDVRFTTRLDEANPVGNVLTVLHEAGHALYEQGFPAEFGRTALLDAPSLGAHESQSRFWENHVGRTAAFWRRLEPAMRGRFPEAMDGLTAADLHGEATAVERSLIRVEADEVTYNLHIALRFELELALMRGDLTVADLPAAWDERSGSMLGVTPSSPADGVMQDIHWAEGMFGYFPTYTLGSLYAAQLAETADAALGGLEAAVEEGRLAEVLAVMRDLVHRHGGMYDTPDLMRRATGRPLSADALVRHLTRVVDGA